MQDRVSAGFRDRLVEPPVGIPGERDEADVRMILTQARDRGDAVHERHVQVDDDGVRVEVVGELDCVEAVLCDADDRQMRLVLDQRA